MNGHAAELYTYTSEYNASALLVWEDADGVLFWFTGSDVDPDTVVEIASSVTPVSQAVDTYEAVRLQMV